MMKGKIGKALAIALVCAMLAGTLAGCGQGGAQDEPDAGALEGMEQGAELDTGGGEGSVGGSEETNRDLAELVDGQETERQDAEGQIGSDSAGSDIEPADGPGTSADVTAPVVGDAEPAGTDDVDAADGDAEGLAYVAPPMPDEIPNTGMSEVKADDSTEAPAEPVAAAPEAPVEEIQEQMVALASSTYQTYLPVASTTDVRNANNYGYIDYGNAKDGYVVVCYTAQTSARLKCLVTGPTGVQYTYNLQQGVITTLPLSDGSGNYTVGLYENVTGSKYAKNLTQTFQASLANEFGPFLYSNQYVDYMSAPNTRATGADLCGRAPDLLGKVDQVYAWVVNNISYDKNKARTVQSGYLPVLDTVLANRTGICFDYAALMAGMLRSQGIPCKLVVGYAGTAYHAWISVWSEESGWIEGVIYFNGDTWQRMDPTFASSGGQSDSVMQYIGNGQNYREKYLY